MFEGESSRRWCVNCSHFLPKDETRYFLNKFTITKFSEECLQMGDFASFLFSTFSFHFRFLLFCRWRSLYGAGSLPDALVTVDIGLIKTIRLRLLFFCFLWKNKRKEKEKRQDETRRRKNILLKKPASISLAS